MEESIKKLSNEALRLGKGVGAAEMSLHIRKMLIENIDLPTYIRLLPLIEELVEDYKGELVLEGIYTMERKTH